MLTASPWAVSDPHFTEEESEAQSGGVTSPVRHLSRRGRSGGAGARTRARRRQRAPPPGPDTLPGSHLFRSRPRAPRLRTTFPGRTRARARAPGPPPWRPCCPGRSSSPVSCNLATTPPPPVLGRWGLQAPGGEAYRGLAPTRAELQARGGETVKPPAGWGPRATRGQRRRPAGRGSQARGEPGKRGGTDPEGPPGW